MKDHNQAHEQSKLQKGKGRLKKVAREKGQAQALGAESQSQILGSKRQSTVVFTEDEEFMVHKKQCRGFTRVSSDQNLSAMAVRQHYQEP